MSSIPLPSSKFIKGRSGEFPTVVTDEDSFIRLMALSFEMPPPENENDYLKYLTRQ